MPYFPPDRVGGVGEVVAHLHRGLLAEGHESNVLTAGEPRGEQDIHRVGRSPLGFVLGSAFHSGLVERCDLVHCHHGDPLPFLLAQRLRRRRVPLLVTFHVSSRSMGRALRPHRIDGRRFGGGWRDGFYRYLMAPLHTLVDGCAQSLADRVSFISRSAARDVLGEARAQSATVLYNGVEPAAPGSAAAADPPTDLLYVGAFGQRKRTHLLPLLLSEIRAKRPRTRLRIVGAGPAGQPALDSAFRELGLSESVIWEGRVRSEEIEPFYRAARVLVVPSVYEGLPMVILEAFAAGLPCVATRVSGHPEVIEEGVNGFLVDLDDPVQMAERCLRILASRELGASMSEAARRTVRDRFSVRDQVAGYLSLYQSLVTR